MFYTSEELIPLSSNYPEYAFIFEEASSRGVFCRTKMHQSRRPIKSVAMYKITCMCLWIFHNILNFLSSR